MQARPAASSGRFIKVNWQKLYIYGIRSMGVLYVRWVRTEEETYGGRQTNYCCPNLDATCSLNLPTSLSLYYTTHCIVYIGTSVQCSLNYVITILLYTYTHRSVLYYYITRACERPITQEMYFTKICRRRRRCGQLLKTWVFFKIIFFFLIISAVVKRAANCAEKPMDDGRVTANSIKNEKITRYVSLKTGGKKYI